MEECYNCSNTISSSLSSALHEYNTNNCSNPLCQTCSNILLFKSDYDSTLYPREDRIISYLFSNYKYITEQQEEDLEENSHCCQDCNERIEPDDVTFINDYSICESCRDENWSLCSSCDEYESNEYCERVGRRTYCEGCRDDNLSWCNGCDEYHEQDDVSYSDAEDCYYCQSCTPAQRIRNYSYKPPLNFFKVASAIDKPLFMGIELEIDGNKEIADDLVEFPDEKYVFKEDSSTDGFEIVSQPMTIEYVKQEEQWDKKLKELKRRSFTSYEGGKCGIHVHISKDSVSKIDAWKMVYFMHKCSRQIHKFTQRTVEQRNDWANYRSPAYMGLPTSALAMSESYPQNSQRYSALNFLPNTIEFRVFRGTLDHTRFVATLEFVKVLREYVGSCGINHFMSRTNNDIWNSFYTYASKFYGGNSCLVQVMKKYNLNRELVY